MCFVVCSVCFVSLCLCVSVSLCLWVGIGFAQGWSRSKHQSAPEQALSQHEIHHIYAMVALRRSPHQTPHKFPPSSAHPCHGGTQKTSSPDPLHKFPPYSSHPCHDHLCTFYLCTHIHRSAQAENATSTSDHLTHTFNAPSTRTVPKLRSSCCLKLPPQM